MAEYVVSRDLPAVVGSLRQQGFTLLFLDGSHIVGDRSFFDEAMRQLPISPKVYRSSEINHERFAPSLSWALEFLRHPLVAIIWEHADNLLTHDPAEMRVIVEAMTEAAESAPSPDNVLLWEKPQFRVLLFGEGVPFAPWAEAKPTEMSPRFPCPPVDTTLSLRPVERVVAQDFEIAKAALEDWGFVTYVLCGSRIGDREGFQREALRSLPMDPPMRTARLNLDAFNDSVGGAFWLMNRVAVLWRDADVLMSSDSETFGLLEGVLRGISRSLAKPHPARPWRVQVSTVLFGTGDSFLQWRETPVSVEC